MGLRVVLVLTALITTSFCSWCTKYERAIMTVRPKLTPNANIIRYKADDEASVRRYVTALDNFLKAYRIKHENGALCSYDRPAQPNEVCEFELSEIIPCTREEQYNYHRSGPCIFLKLNKIYNWVPKFYNDSNELPEKMPKELKEYIGNMKKPNDNRLKTVWVSCEGENAADIENIGPISYLPHRGFPGYFLPYKNQAGYVSPIVAVYFESPTRGVLINIICKAWARNLHRTDLMGSVGFRLMVE